MEYRRLGKSGLKVSPLCLGTMMFGDRTDERVSGTIVASAKEAGVNFIDTADRYAEGRSEEICGRLIAAERADWILATKVANPGGPGPNDRGTSRRWILQACEASLKRLGTDWIDVYYLHRDDEDTPMEETIATLGDLIRSGKIRYYGLSNFRAWRLATFAETARAMGVPAPIVCQPCYNLMDRTAELELLPACAHHGLGVFAYSPLARGVLTAKYAPGALPGADTRAGRSDKRIIETEFRPESLAVAQDVAALAASRGTTTTALAIGWVLNNALVSGVIAGPRTMEQWRAYVEAMRFRFTAEDEAAMSALVPPGHPTTPGYTDPQYPVTGRRPASGSLRA
ncbi:MAG: aldo/keto reductase [Alphaproteobacteria bacterium]|nr:aldo/keto reductase [Alphaproteobacteria bacterium]